MGWRESVPHPPRLRLVALESYSGLPAAPSVVDRSWGWSALHLAVLPLLRDWRLIALVGTSWPFWTDIHAGNGVTFVFVAAALALASSRAGTWATSALALLIPRPLIVPLILWILWKRPEWRGRFAALFVIHAALVLATGWGNEWLTVLIGSSRDEFANGFNMAPSSIIGPWWTVIGVPLAAWLTWKGRVGLSGLALAPYWFSYYLLFGFLDLYPMIVAHGRPVSGGVPDR